MRGKQAIALSKATNMHIIVKMYSIRKGRSGGHPRYCKHKYRVPLRDLQTGIP